MPVVNIMLAVEGVENRYDRRPGCFFGSRECPRSFHARSGDGGGQGRAYSEIDSLGPGSRAVELDFELRRSARRENSKGKIPKKGLLFLRFEY